MPVLPYNTLLIAVVQTQDTDNAHEALSKMDISVQQLPSTGGFLGRKNSTLLIALPEEKKQSVLEALNSTCRQRIEYIAVPLESAPLPLPTPTPISIGGATVFELEIEHYEEI